ncbi:LLM class flavin-dependent oxidoreductase [Frankia sp. CNm7]|uniref:LLM class flavin-dependent oxidoreductase n=1 Tax=Frankia nepalensis TaxID=1836974 RepID=A0A937RIW2_9ACTN|nr:LLM class flavin-dependent oxidoreductase [Frankia nepalensis]MBL7497659.1 LLM class flavin-dependent oxidoreductase [Frankia nepalensis]MBL7510026.1 LLM class flavin-dependent oxidoreductase [Frankia nepalensis]MBL7517564.1 LLM class flavin-dependent oxidoreductase [Frankia nepalensis]MBL7631047.1 LLM class flavin-dependent oxidoreductase [Frankia nepalensis]
MDIGVLIPTGAAQWGAAGDPRELVAFGRRAERSGFSSLFVNDTLVSPRIEALTMLAALAPATETAVLGTGALLPFLRRPLQAAQALASVDLLAGGRLVVAVGAGFPGRFGQPLYALSEVPWERRFARLDETVALWRALWTGAGSFHGEILRFADLPPMTRPFHAGGPPIWLGGATPAALARAGRWYDGWLPYPPDPADYASGLGEIRDAAADAGRAAADVTPALFVSARVDEDTERGRQALDAYARATYGMPLADLEKIQAVVTGSADQVLAGLLRYVAAGARHVVVRLGALDPRSQNEQLDRLAALIPALRASAGPALTPGTRAGQPSVPTSASQTW